jgi:hypothetical protein
MALFCLTIKRPTFREPCHFLLPCCTLWPNLALTIAFQLTGTVTNSQGRRVSSGHVHVVHLRLLAQVTPISRSASRLSAPRAKYKIRGLGRFLEMTCWTQSIVEELSALPQNMHLGLNHAGDSFLSCIKRSAYIQSYLHQALV